MLLDGALFFERFVNTAVVKDSFVVDEGIEERSFLFVGEEEEGAENEWLDRLLDPE